VNLDIEAAIGAKLTVKGMVGVGTRHKPHTILSGQGRDRFEVTNARLARRMNFAAVEARVVCTVRVLQTRVCIRGFARNMGVASRCGTLAEVKASPIDGSNGHTYAGVFKFKRVSGASIRASKSTKTAAASAVKARASLEAAASSAHFALVASSSAVSAAVEFKAIAAVGHFNHKPRSVSATHRKASLAGGAVHIQFGRRQRRIANGQLFGKDNFIVNFGAKGPRLDEFVGGIVKINHSILANSHSHKKSGQDKRSSSKKAAVHGCCCWGFFTSA